MGPGALVERCRAGDHEAWERLVDRYGRLVHAVALREGLSREDAADVTQDVFIALMEHLDRLRRPERLPWWLMTVARRMAWHRRDRGRTVDAVAEVDLVIDLDAGTVVPERRDGAELPDGWLEAAWVHEAVATLGHPCRALLELLFLDPVEPSYAQVSRLLDMPVGSIGACRARCLDRLRRRLGTEEWS